MSTPLEIRDEPERNVDAVDKAELGSVISAGYNHGCLRDTEVNLDDRFAGSDWKTLRLSDYRLRGSLPPIGPFSCRAALRHRLAYQPGREGHTGCAWGGRRGVRSGTEEGLHLKCRGQHDWGHRPQTNESHQEAADGS